MLNLTFKSNWWFDDENDSRLRGLVGHAQHPLQGPWRLRPPLRCRLHDLGEKRRVLDPTVLVVLLGLMRTIASLLNPGTFSDFNRGICLNNSHPTVFFLTQNYSLPFSLHPGNCKYLNFLTKMMINFCRPSLNKNVDWLLSTSDP